MKQAARWRNLGGTAEITVFVPDMGIKAFLFV